MRLYHLWQKLKYILFRSSTMLTLILLFIIGSSILVTSLERSENDSFLTIFDGVWWALITMSTTGYGDKVPLTPGGRVVAAIVIVGGIAIMSLLSGALASIFVRIDKAVRGGFMKAAYLENHFVICGWKRNEMLEYIQRIAEMNQSNGVGRDGKNLVIIADVSPDLVAKIRSHPRLKHIHFIRGSCQEETILDAANITRAKQAILLADTSGTHSTLEADTKTIMTLLAIRSISKSIYLIAELHDKKYEHYLRQTACNEVFYAGEFTQLMLASMSSTSGVGNIFMNLMSKKNGITITTEHLPERFIQQQFGDVKKEITNHDKKLLIGILEHVGNPFTVKLAALRDAQKTANMSRLVENLQDAKNIKVNNPILMPDDNYHIAPNSMAIYLSKNEYDAN